MFDTLKIGNVATDGKDNFIYTLAFGFILIRNKKIHGNMKTSIFIKEHNHYVDVKSDVFYNYIANNLTEEQLSDFYYEILRFQDNEHKMFVMEKIKLIKAPKIKTINEEKPKRQRKAKIEKGTTKNQGRKKQKQGGNFA